MVPTLRAVGGDGGSDLGSSRHSCAYSKHHPLLGSSHSGGEARANEYKIQDISNIENYLTDPVMSP